jgi:pSer/pThr/pTyr-binding forkhead associated (FHA) protein
MSDAAFCSSCGTELEIASDQTQAISRVDLRDPLAGHGDIAVDTLTPTLTATLMVRSGPQAGERFSLGKATTRIGRHPDSDVSLDDISVSRRHAEIERQGTEYVLRDAGSLNGTYVNQRRSDSVVLQQGDEILIGRFRLLFLAPAEQV